MACQTVASGPAIRSTVCRDGTLKLELAELAHPEPAAGKVVIAVKAAPVHPADLLCLLAGANPAEGAVAQVDGQPVFTAPLSGALQAAAHARLERPLGVGLEGSGLVIAAGAGAGALLDRRVAFQCTTPAAYAAHVTVNAADCLPLPEDTSFRQGAAAFCNPLTALAMVETLRQTGHRAMVHTAAASSLGQMLVRICQEDGIALVNVVRRPEQAQMLRDLGARWVCDSSAASFADHLAQALSETGATIAFDAIGGGMMAARLIAAMEACAVKRMEQFNPYGSMEAKTVYVYGRLDPSPTLIPPGAYGMVWSVEGWAMPPVLARAGTDRTAALVERIGRGLNTTFSSTFKDEVPLDALLRPDVLVACSRKETGGKYLVVPAAA